MTKNFANDVAIQDAHGAKEECSMGGEAQSSVDSFRSYTRRRKRKKIAAEAQRARRLAEERKLTTGDTESTEIKTEKGKRVDGFRAMEHALCINRKG